MQERASENHSVYSGLPLQSHSVIFTVSCWLRWSALPNVGGGSKPL